MERVTFIKEGLNELGTKAGVFYTNQEIIDKLKELQAALSRGIFEKTHAENFMEREIIRHFEMLAAEYGLESSDRFYRFKKNVEELGMTIGTYIKGMAGERSARKALKLLGMDKGVKILYNVCLEEDDCQAEYDAIVLAPYGVFVIEVKNWAGSAKITSKGLLKKIGFGEVTYDLSGRMGMKEALLRSSLGDLFPKKYINMVLFSNEKVEIEDDYHRIPYVIGGGISNEIRLFAKSGNALTEKQISKIEARILEVHKEQKTLCDVKCEEIIDDYASLMAEIEEKARLNAIDENQEAPKRKNVDAVNNYQPAQSKGFWSSINWGEVVAVGAALLGTPLALWAARNIKYGLKIH